MRAIKFEGKIHRMRLGPKAEESAVLSPTAAELDALSITIGPMDKVIRTGSLTHVVFLNVVQRP